MTATKLFPFVIIFIGLGNNHSDVLGTESCYIMRTRENIICQTMYSLGYKTICQNWFLD